MGQQPGQSHRPAPAGQPDGAPRYRFATRLNSFRSVAPEPGVAGLLRAAARVPGLSAAELNYPQHFAGTDVAAVAALLAELGLPCTALNLRFEGAEFAVGTLTSPGAATRERAIGLAIAAVEAAARLGASHVVLWLAEDGFDYPFQVDYARLWAEAIAGLRRVAAHDPAIRVSVEPKPSEPRRFSLIRSTSDGLLAARGVDLPNFGVTLDVCHSLMAGEHPPAAAALALAAGKLFGVHLNDGHGPADDGLAVGSVHPGATLELLAVLRAGGYAGTIYFDTFPEPEDPVAECAANIATVVAMERALDGLSEVELAAGRETHDANEARRLAAALLGRAFAAAAEPAP